MNKKIVYKQNTAHLFEACVLYFNEHVNKTANCWEWVGTYRNLPSPREWRNAYMRVQINKTKLNISASVFAYNMEHYPNKPSPLSYAKGDEIRRECNNYKCVNPAHLKLGNRTDTINAMIERGTTQKGNTNGVKYDADAIRSARASGMDYKEISEKFGCGKGTISYIINKAKR